MARHETGQKDNAGAGAPAEVRFARKSVRLPGNRLARMALGVALILGGLLGFLPVLGVWMIPLGLIVLAVDLPVLRPVRARLDWLALRALAMFNRQRRRFRKKAETRP